MARLLTVVLVFAVVACVLAAPGKRSRGVAHASDGSIGVGAVDGGTFGDGSFSIGHGGSSSGIGDAGHGGNQASKS
ncbi:hypothetical protein B5X24_HaOG204378 [Helicoverpa armigera]|uniref:Uncharacterized protein n=1 Tax=Helicoverpa armigera TaxID=29058 RepID=A0A2W1BV07_HELAM|nr:hypothetical protein B5X24_HaOG204378 [Helicoverpa armigera]